MINQYIEIIFSFIIEHEQRGISFIKISLGDRSYDDGPRSENHHSAAHHSHWSKRGDRKGSKKSNYSEVHVIVFRFQKNGNHPIEF